jgi:ABC-2 type transport system ATP-binding protein
MVYIIFFVLSFLPVVLISWYHHKKTLNFQKLLRILAVVLFLVYLPRLLRLDAINHTFNLFLRDVTTPIDADTTWLFPVFKSIVMIFLRWFSLLIITLGIANAFFRHKLAEVAIAFIGPVLFLLNVIFYDAHLYAIMGETWPTFSFQGIQFLIENSMLGIFSMVHLMHIFVKRIQISKKEAFRTIYTIFFAAFAVMPLGLLYHFFGYYGEVPKDFTNSHLMVIIFPVILTVFAYLAFRKRSQEAKNLFITFLVFASFVQYFYIPRFSIAGLPLHLCNTAVLILLVAVPFKKRGVFYFAYFANVIGAIAAIVLPNYSQDLNHIYVLHFGYNHLYALVIPILAVALKMFPKPKLKDMVKAIIVFTLYFIVVVNLNAWFRNYHGSVDYFYTYSDFLSDMFNARRLQYNYTIEFYIGELHFVYFYVFHIIYYFAFIFLMFMTWVVYDQSYQAAQRHRDLRTKQKQMRMDMFNLRVALKGRPASEPINKEGVNMIKISNFSKRYGHANEFAVKDFSLEVYKGEVFGFLGHNGAGKSTTIKSLVGIQSITEGEMEICGYSIKTQPLEAKLQMGYVSDNHAVYEKLTGREYIDYVADLYQVPQALRTERLEKYIDQFLLRHAIDHEIKSYSHGMKQKLVVIASLIHEPPVWILDEPLTGLDPTSAFQIKESMREHAQ